MRAVLFLVALVAVSACSPSDSDAPIDVSGDPASDAQADGLHDAGGDGAPGTLGDCLADVEPNRVADFIVFEGPDGLTVAIARTIIDAPAVGETFPLDMVRFAVDDGGAMWCIRDGAALEYTFGHHNWDEWGSALVGDRRYEIRLRYFATAEARWTDTLSAYDGASGSPLFEDGALTAVDCWTDPPGDLNFCLNRPRADLQ